MQAAFFWKSLFKKSRYKLCKLRSIEYVEIQPKRNSKSSNGQNHKNSLNKEKDSKLNPLVGYLGQVSNITKSRDFACCDLQLELIAKTFQWHHMLKDNIHLTKLTCLERAIHYSSLVCCHCQLLQPVRLNWSGTYNCTLMPATFN